MEMKKEKSKGNKEGRPPFYDATPPRMSRTVGKGESGNNWSIPNGAKYGLGEGKQPTRMDRSVGKGKGGNEFRQGKGHAAKSARKDTGANSMQSGKFGVEGVPLKDGEGRYGV